jgi:mevalonate kinase
MVRAFAPGKCILFGEHAVVYGHPAVAVAIEAGVEVRLEESERWVLDGMNFEPSRHPHIKHIITNVFEYDGSPLKIDINSTLFPAAGLGSSAALSNAMGAALQELIEPSGAVDAIKLAKISHSAEAIAQEGRASPTDTAASALGGSVVVSGERLKGINHRFDAELITPEGERNWSIHSAELHPNLAEAWLVLGFTGKGSPTGKMVAGVADLLEKEPSHKEDMLAIANITNAGLAALAAGNLPAVGIAMDACHKRLQNIQVSSPALDLLVNSARPHSFGAKLTGAGGGGCMVALTNNPKRVAEAIEIAGGKPLISRFGTEGVRLID